MMNDAPTLPAGVSASIEREIEIEARPEIVFDAMLEEMNANFTDMSGKTMNLKLEPHPGGRWFRDLGNNTGHLWGHVQVIKPPTLLEITGPLMMSFPVINHVTYRSTSPGRDGMCHLSIKHRMFGELDERYMRAGEGWAKFLAAVKTKALSSRTGSNGRSSK